MIHKFKKLNIKMETFIQDKLQEMDMEHFIKKTDLYIQEIGKTIRNMAMEKCSLSIKMFIKGIGKMMKSMEMENLYTTMEIYIRGPLLMGKKMDLEKLFMKIQISIKVNGKTIYKMIKMDSLYIKMVIYILENFRME